MGNETTNNGVSTEPTYKLNLKVDGKEITKEFTESELVAHIQKDLSADERLRLAAERKSELDIKEKELLSKEEELKKTDEELKQLIDNALSDIDESEVPQDPTDTDIEKLLSDDPVLANKIAQLEQTTKQQQEQLALIQRDAIYKDIKNDRDSLIKQYNLTAEQANEVAKFALDKELSSLDDAFKIMYYNKERPPVLTSQVSSGKINEDQLKVFKQALREI